MAMMGWTQASTDSKRQKLYDSLNAKPFVLKMQHCGVAHKVKIKYFINILNCLCSL